MMLGLVERIEHVVFEHHKAPRSVQWLLRLLRYPYALAHDIERGDLSLRAMSLVYTTLLSIVPLLALSFSVLKGLGYHRDLEPLLLQFLEPMGKRGVELTGQVMQFVENARGGLLGTLGFAFLLYTAVSMIQKVEESFNLVWRVSEPRSFGRRVSEYISVLIVGPIVIVTALGILAKLGDYRAVQSIAAIEPFGTLLLWVGRVTPYLLVAGAFTFLYAFIPNTKVNLLAASIGGGVAGVLWVGSGVLFASFVTGSSGAMLIYAGFAVVLLALFWLHISWLILLIGAQLAFYVQYPQCLRPGAGTTQVTASGSERLALSVMYLLGKEFALTGSARQNIVHYTASSLAERLFIPVASLSPIVRCLEAAGLLQVTDNERLTPARDLSAIALDEILEAVRNDRADRAMQHASCVAAADAVAAAASDAMRASVRNKTLKDLIAE